MDKLTSTQILEAGLDDWRQLAQGIHARFRTGSFTKGLRFLTAVTEAAEAANHHPDVTLTYPHVDLLLISHDVGALTSRDVDLARTISSIAAEHGLKPQPGALAEVDLALDTAAPAAAGPFWAALLTGDASNVRGEDVVDPSGRVPLLWFQETDSHETPRQRFHLDVWVPHDVAGERIAAAVAAGGVVVDDSQAPSFTVLADGEGNRACVCTALER
ncbi:4a-hydroxytetrahydrobiopterin dehydratase [Arthrobacter subterraneus]|uniref:Putative pterin-4-alpha-carbinolamine dehydratase n=1 Tax=Arthrobacter subterraneus TaxID=335973 RepID=A0A1G8CTK7_9MICC|nr:4a-hydroxytetrahydrobiopterin dehydratase [Arthrobacter subterraneus]SDH48519.1 4a-hydroxytetrahydrobiopterin dehydratase [Arthrobacter subterraneus]